MKDTLGLPMATILIIKDITRIKETELALKENECKTAELCEEAPYAIITLDDTGKLKSVNPAAVRMLGYGEEELTGKIFVMSEVVPTQHVQELLKAVRKALEGTHEPVFELELLRSDRTLLHLQANPLPIKQFQKTTAVQLILRDITEERRLQEELKSLQEEVESRFKHRLEEPEKSNQELKREIAKVKNVPGRS